MGCASSSDHGDSESTARNAAIDAELSRERSRNRSQVKLLILGAGESGKSTILKQMQVLHRGGFTPEERELYREVLFSNTIQTMQVVIQSTEVLELDPQPQNEANCFFILEIDSTHRSEESALQIATVLLELWADPAIKETLKRRGSRLMTQQIIESAFQIGKVGYRIFDVGGQRSERKKWIHCFEGRATFTGQRLYEDEVTTRMSESLMLFESISNSRWFEKSTVVVFFNKCDLLAAKLKTTSVKLAFPQFEGDEKSFKAVGEFFQSTFLRLYKQQKPIYSHFTTAIDSTALDAVVYAVTDTINRNMLEELKCLV